MPDDNMPTARAAALSPSPPVSSSSPLSLFGDFRPPWSRVGSGERRSSTLPSTREVVTLRDQLINYTSGLLPRLQETWRKMNVWQRAGAVIAVIALLGLGVGFMILTGHLFKWLRPLAEKWEHSTLAVFVLWLSIFFVSFPPMVGWTTLGTICGFAFGWWKGWLLYASATVVGSTCSFIVSRTVLSQFVNKMMENDKRFAALSLTLKYDGLKLLCMIRLCPLPYSICNGAVSTFPTVQPLMYGLATAIITPKLFVPTFIGSRLRILSGENEQMSTASKVVNICSIVISVSVGIFTGWYIYKRTLARAKELEAKERADIRRTLQADHAAHRPHGRFSEDPSANAAASVLARDEEERIGLMSGDSDSDKLDITIEEDGVQSDGRSGPSTRQSNRQYQDEFTDNDSDLFNDGDGSDTEVYALHSHVQRGSAAR